MKKPSSNPCIEPLGDRVVVSAPPEKSSDNKEQTVGGIVIPEVAQTGRVIRPYYVASVIAKGPDCKRVKVFDKVIVARQDLFHVEVAATESYMIREQNIVALVR